MKPAADAATPAAGTTSEPIPAGVLGEPAIANAEGTPVVVAPALVAPTRAAPLAIPQGIVLPEATSSVIARVPASMQPDLRDRARLWHAWTPAQREGFRQRAIEWDAQPRAVQARLRERYAAWRALDPVAAEAVENAVQAFARRTPEEQTALHAQFDLMEPLQQRGWLLGPAIGVDLSLIHI